LLGAFFVAITTKSCHGWLFSHYFNAKQALFKAFQAVAFGRAFCGGL